MIFTYLELTIIGLPLPIQVLYVNILTLAGLKAVLIALFFQHLIHEPKALSGFAVLGFAAALIFMGISLFSMLGITVGI